MGIIIFSENNMKFIIKVILFILVNSLFAIK